MFSRIFFKNMNFTSICTFFDFGHSYCKEFVTFISYKRKKEDEKLATLFPIPYCTDKQFQNSNDTNFGTWVSFFKYLLLTISYFTILIYKLDNILKILWQGSNSDHEIGDGISFHVPISYPPNKWHIRHQIRKCPFCQQLEISLRSYSLPQGL